jgi:GDP-4-dehydro-6-deoxy-D-mannose reductase
MRFGGHSRGSTLPLVRSLPMRTLVTGANGFVGPHALARLRADGVEAHEFEGDIRDPDVCLAQVRAAAPDAVLHLAAIASVADAWRQPELVYDVNVGGTRNLLAAVARVAPGARVVLVSSAEVYGAVPEAEQPIGEDAPMRPLSPYAESKVEAEAVARSAGLDVVIARPFPHIGPGQDDRFAIASFASQIAAIERDDTAPVIHVGNLDARRDFSDVRSIVGAYALLLRAPEAVGAYNVCTGRAQRVGDLLTRLLALARRPIEIVIDAERLRPADIPLLCGDPSRIEDELGWRPGRSIEQTLADTLDFFRAREV